MKSNILEQAGTLLSSQAVGPKLEWVHSHEPEVFERATGWYGSNSYIAAKLTGEYVMDHHTASQCDPLYATREFDWNQRWANPDLPSPAASAPGVAERCRRKRDSGRGVSHRDTRRHTGFRGNGRCLLRGVLGRRPRNQATRC